MRSFNPLVKKRLVTELESISSSKEVIWKFGVRGATLLSSGVWLVSLSSAAYAELPIPCAGNCGKNIAHVEYGKVNLPATGDPNKMVVQQLSDKAILNWKQFNVSPGAQVIFDQNSSSAVALNRIHSGDVSKIQGEIRSNGQVYLINPRGILFGKGAKINTAGAVASTLDMPNGVFLNGGVGTAAQQGSSTSAFKKWQQRTDSTVTADDNAQIKIEPGATIQTADGGLAMVIAPEVINEGEIRAGKTGQVIAAASQDEVYLWPSSDSELRGFMVEVKTGGEVTNKGKIFADRGNATLVGKTVNQDGTVRATTSVSLNGSVILKAQDSYELVPDSNSSSVAARATKSGKLTLGAKSKTEAVNGNEVPQEYTADQLEAFLEKAIDEQDQIPSKVSLAGKTVHLTSGAQVTARGGQVAIDARTDPRNIGSKRDKDVRVQIDSGAKIDVSGADAVLPMDRNVLEVQLYSNELKDSPVQRSGPLRGKKVYIDVRKGTEIADIDAALAAIPKTLEERTSKGGSVKIVSDGDVVTQAGSTIDASGGSIRYESGMMHETLLMQGDRIIPISEASPEEQYTGIAGVLTYTSKKWGTSKTYGDPDAAGRFWYEEGYVEGADAGSITLAGRGMMLNGDLLATTQSGHYQRSDRADGGSLYIGLPAGVAPVLGVGGDLRPDAMMGAIELAEKNKQRNVALGDELLDEEVNHFVLSQQVIKQGGFQSVNLSSNDKVVISAAADALDLGEKGALTVQAPKIELNRSIQATSGNVNLQAQKTGDKFIFDGSDAYGLQVADAVSINVSGAWVNDDIQSGGALSDAPILLDGGTVSLSSAAGMPLAIGNNVEIHADGGAYRNASGKLKQGSGGKISLDAGSAKQSDNDNDALSAAKLSLGENTKFTAFAFDGGTGGSFSLKAKDVIIAPDLAKDVMQDPSGVIHVSTEFFENSGFNTINLTAVGGTLTFSPGVDIDAQQSTRFFNSDYRLLSSTQDLDSIAHLEAGTDYKRKAVNMSFTQAAEGRDNAVENNLNLDSDVKIHTEAGGKVTLENKQGGSLGVDGSIVALGGNISLSSLRDTSGSKKTDVLFDPALGVYLGAGAELDVSGVFKPTYNTLGLTTGEVLDGGTVSLTSDGYVAIGKNAHINVSGSESKVDYVRQYVPGSSVAEASKKVASDAGALKVTAAEGFIWQGDVNASANNALGAQSGTLTLDVAVGVRTDKYGLSTDPAFASLPALSHDVLITNDVAVSLPDNFSVSKPTALDAATYDGKYNISKKNFDAAQFANLNINLPNQTSAVADGRMLSIDNSIKLESGVDFVVPYQFVAEASNFSLLRKMGSSTASEASLSAGYMKLGTNSALSLNAFAPAEGGLVFKANDIDLDGAILFNNANNVTLQANDSIRLTGGDVKNTRQIVASENLTLAAKQVYSATFSNMALFALDASRDGLQHDGAIRIHGIGENSDLVNSAYGQVALNAATIEQAGTLKAPHGSIDLNAEHQAFNSATHTISSTGKKGSLDLLANSLTSVSGEGQVVLAGKLSGDDWLQNDAITLFSAQSNLIPEKSVSLNGKSINFVAGATVNTSGGGDILAAEFVAGPGGSSDIRNSANSFAIMKADAMPYDNDLFSQAGIKPNETIYLAGGSGVDAGEYYLLPSTYALLPGAKLIKAVSGYQTLIPGSDFTKLDGIPVVQGVRKVDSIGAAEAAYTAYEVYDSDAIRLRSEYKERYASEILATQAKKFDVDLPYRPQDAGKLCIETESALTLGGKVNGVAGKNGLGGQVDIVADNLAVVDRLSVKPKSGVVELLDNELNALGAESLLLGGTRSKEESSTLFHARADSVKIGAHTELRGREIILVANDHVDVAGSASLSTTKAQGRTPDSADWQLESGAMLAVSENLIDSFERQDKISDATIKVNQGAAINSGNSTVFDTLGQATLGGTLSLGNGNLFLGADVIHAGANGNSGITLGSNFQHFASLSSADIRANEFHLHDGATLETHNLNLQANQLISDLSAGHAASISADHVTLLGGNQNAVTNAASGSLIIDAKQVLMGAGSLNAMGFAEINVNASEAVAAVGRGALNADRANIDITAPLLTATANSRYGFNTEGDFNLTQREATGQFNGQTYSGVLSLSAQNIKLDGTIQSNGGVLIANAKNAIDLTQRTVIDLGGKTLDFIEKQVDLAGGLLSLSAENVGINAAAGAKVTLSGAGSSDAGDLELNTPNGELKWHATTVAQHKDDAEGGSVKVDANSLGEDESVGLNGMLATLQSNGFDKQWDIRIRNASLSDLSLSTVTNLYQFALSADNATVHVNAGVNASGKRGGQVYIAGGNGVDVNAAISAVGSKATGGQVTLDAGKGTLTLGENSLINVAGNTPENGGRIRLIANQSEEGTGLQTVVAEGAKLQGAQLITLGGRKVYEGATGEDVNLDAGFMVGVQTDSRSFASHASEILTELGLDSVANIFVVPEIEIRSSGNLNILDEINFANWNFSNGSEGSSHLPVGFTLRAAENINVQNKVTDGFQQDYADNLSGYTYDRLLDSYSANLSFTAGADLNAVNNRATQSIPLLDNAGDFVMQAGSQVRTGTGNINITAARDVLWTEEGGGSIYSAGRSTGRDLDNDTLLGVNGGYMRGGRYLPTNGGDVSVNAGRNISDRNSMLTQYTNSSRWLRTESATDLGSEGKLGGTYVAFANIRTDLAAIGGGDLSVTAGNNLENISLAAPTTLRELDNQHEMERIGGGQISVDVRGNALTPYITAGDGGAKISVKGDLAANLNAQRMLQDSSVSSGVGGMFEVQGGETKVDVLGSALVSSVFDPTLIANIDSLYDSYGSPVEESQPVLVSSQTDNSEFILTASGKTTWASADAVSELYGLDSNAKDQSKYLLPAAFGLISTGSDIAMTGGADINLATSRRAELSLLASDSIDLASRFVMNDDPSDRMLHPGESVNPFTNYSPLASDGVGSVSIVAKDGGIVGNASESWFTKPVRIYSGNDIANLSFRVTHQNESDVSRVTAKGNIVWGKNYGNGYANSSSGSIRIEGPGRMEILAGGDVILPADFSGISSSGNLYNAMLPEVGADISIYAGLKGTTPQWDALLKPITSADALQREQFAKDVLVYVRTIDKTITTERDAVVRFESLNESQRDAFTSTTFSTTAERENLLSAVFQASAIAKALPQSGAVDKLVVAVTADTQGKSLIIQEMRELRGNDLLSADDAIALFADLDIQRKQELLANVMAGLTESKQRSLATSIYSSLSKDNKPELAEAVFFDTLKSAGRNVNELGDKAYDKGYQAVATVFAESSYKGDKNLEKGKYGGGISLEYSRVYSEDGGNISMFTPGGGINAGGYAKPANLALDKKPSELGIVAQKTGSVNMYVYDDVLVNAQRVFTLGGGNITMWASNGNIDAGRGAKTAISAPAPTARIVNGQIQFEFGGAVAGSGIRAILTDSKVTPGDVDLIAPVGEVNAGEAGIGSAGNLTIAAARVVGADNIEVGGVSVGVPMGDVGGLSAGLSGLSGVTAGATRSAEDSTGSGSKSETAESDAALSWLEVTVIGFDDDSLSSVPASSNGEQASPSNEQDSDKEKKKPKKSQQI